GAGQGGGPGPVHRAHGRGDAGRHGAAPRERARRVSRAGADGSARAAGGGADPPPSDPGAARLVEALVGAAADTVRCVLLFGSRMVQASPDRYSAYDLVVVVERYRPFFDALARAGATRKSPAAQAALARVLAPS